MKKKLLLTVASVALVASTTILAEHRATIVCPSADVIKTVKFDIARPYNDCTYDDCKWDTGIRSNHFDTKLEWEFLLEGIAALNDNEAISNGEKIVTTLMFVNGPYHGGGEGVEWEYCVYDAVGYRGYAYHIV